MPVRGERLTREPPPSDATRRLSEALLGAELSTRPNSILVVKFDDARDLKIASRTLLQLRDSYEPRRE